MSSTTSYRKKSLAAIAEFVSEFSGINRSPNFKKASTCITPPGSATSSGQTTPTRKMSEPTQRKYSVIVAVGVNPLPQPCTGTGTGATNTTNINNNNDEKIKLI